jgi:hypothetical protein
MSTSPGPYEHKTNYSHRDPLLELELVLLLVSLVSLELLEPPVSLWAVVVCTIIDQSAET